MAARDLAGKRVAVLGLARQGTALVRYLAAKGARITVSDMKEAGALKKEMDELAGYEVEYRLGGHPPGLLEGIDLLCLSGGVPTDLPIVAEARERSLPLTNDTQLFLEAAPAKVVGITGSSGKTTTTTLVGRMAACAAEAGLIRKAWVGGNIGNPLLNEVNEMRPEDLAVLELSSFQLELAERSPQVAAVLNITPNHLDRHRTMEAYRRAKMRIFEFQAAEDSAVLGWDSPETRGLQSAVRGRRSFFSLSPKAWDGDGAYLDGGRIVVERGGKAEPVADRQAVLLRGEHNLANAVAACAVGAAAGIPADVLARGMAGFRGVPHRLEFVARRRGADWYNDSIATAPERAAAAIRSFDEPIVLLAGGRDKNLPWKEWADLVRRRVDHLVLFGEAADLIHRVLGDAEAGQRPYSVAVVPTLEAAVRKAAETVRPGSVVLLSPGGTSYDAYKDFEERGEAFRALVRAMKAEDE
ncbi:MAG: UDP-N-acetylmuramoyl-L-alanine--D-glutamate ligase [Anaerolineales bacterium]|nr:UDP-N-acetylmuramoyl-L-alanine--D-glutamate ligase [Anaerolineales bacterium]